MWTDENAFGLLLSYVDVEQDEYSLERATFAERFEIFRRACYDYVALHPLTKPDAIAEARGLDLGHAIYLELGEGDEGVDLLAWMKGLRAAVRDQGFDSVGAITHGSRWVHEHEPDEAHTQLVGTTRVTNFCRPSEALRRALYADTATRPEAHEGEGPDSSPGWGAGLYFDVEAVEALGRSPKNAPTALTCAGAAFYRAGR